MGKQKEAKRFDELVFSDDFMFGKVMEDKELCRELLECLLGQPVGELSEIQGQREFRYTSDGKPMRLDVFNKDEEERIYDAEMENLNHKSVRSHELPKRSRFYQGAIDIDYMNKGNMYYELPESNILFICTFDPFGENLGKYTFRAKCEENPELTLEDGTVRIFYNCCYDGDDISEDLKLFYDYLRTGCAESDLTRKIQAAVDKGRKNEIWRTQYMKEWVIVQDAKAEGRDEEKRELITSMLQRGKTVEEIVDFCGFPEELVRAAEEELKLVAMN